MIIHIWMHWFWITTAYFKGFLLFTAQTISFSSISLSCNVEAGLLDHETFSPIISDSYYENNSSQIGQDSNITLPIIIDERNQSVITTPQKLSLSPKEKSAEESTTPELEDTPRTVFDSTSDVEDTYNGKTLDVLQYPLKKFTKFSHLKYGKLKTKGKANEEEIGEEERKLESVKIVEEKVNVNMSIGDSETGHLGPEADKSNENLPKGNTSEILTSDAPDSITTTSTVENDVTSEEGNETVEHFSKVEPNVTISSSTKMPGISLSPVENQKEMEVLKNETLVIESKVEESGTFTTVESFVVKNRVAASTSAHNFEVEQSEMNAGSITGITLGILVIFSLFGAVFFVFYRRRYLNKPQVLHDKCSNLDSSGYIDETSLRENSEEMYSLDNDSFLNSLEAMTIQNYWTENVKHTKL